ncbi:MAG: Mut7-C RNAse domain-containing protein [Acidobacteria bacterium]|nr:Mut7-C RNAse domain-containing protein [Acidobacteriota bacterium]
MRFVVDCMLGSLARWLLILGHDVRYDRAWDDETLLRIAGEEGRTLVTRDRKLAERRVLRDRILIGSQVLEEQIRQILREKGLGVDPRRLFRRCLDCNLATEEAPPASVRDAVPPYVFRTQKRFTRCRGCGKIFWRATHVARMLERLREEFRIPVEEEGGGGGA